MSRFWRFPIFGRWVFGHSLYESESFFHQEQCNARLNFILYQAILNRSNKTQLLSQAVSPNLLKYNGWKKPIFCNNFNLKHSVENSNFLGDLRTSGEALVVTQSSGWEPLVQSSH